MLRERGFAKSPSRALGAICHDGGLRLRVVCRRIRAHPTRRLAEGLLLDAMPNDLPQSGAAMGGEAVLWGQGLGSGPECRFPAVNRRRRPGGLARFLPWETPPLTPSQ